MAILIVSIFAFSFVGLLPVNATVSGTLSIERPDIVVPGGPIEVDASDLTATGGKVYFYLSTDTDPEIASGDIYIDEVKTTKLGLNTLFIPTNVPAEDYYVKASDLRRTGAGAVVTSQDVEVPEEYPTVTSDETEVNVGDEPTIEGEDADDYETFEFYWNEFDVAPVYGPEDVDDDEFTVEEDDEDAPILPSFEIPNSYEGRNDLIVLLTDDDGDTLATYVELTVEAKISIDVLSIEADSTSDQYFFIDGTGFPKGDVEEDTIILTLKDFKTGSTIDTYDTVHVEEEVSEATGNEGVLEVDVTVEQMMEYGVLSLELEVNGKTREFAPDFFASEPESIGDFTTIKLAKANKDEGKIGDKVKFTFINLPSNAEVTINMIGETVSEELVTGDADENGAYKVNHKLTDLPGGEYDVRASVTADGVTREKKISTFEILPKFVIWDVDDDSITSAKVDTEVKLKGTGFPADSTIKTVYFGTKEVDFDNVETGDTGTFVVDEKEAGVALKVPHISGGGQSVTVRVEGTDSEDDAVEAEATLTVKPKLLADDQGDWDVGVLSSPDYEDFDTADIFPGNPIKLVGFGYLAGESVEVKLYDEDDDLLGTATITDGAEANSKGDLELVCLLPAVKKLYPGGEEDVYLKVEGSTSGNTAKLSGLDIAPSDDDNAKLWFGLTDDGELKTSKKVGDTVRVVGCGYRTPSLKLKVDEIDETLKSPSTTYGFFDTTVELPEMEGHKDGKEYTLLEDKTDQTVTFTIKPKIVLTPAEGYPDDTFTVMGTGFEDDEDVELVWIGAAEDDELDDVDGDDVDDGSFEIDLTVPAAVPQSYRLRADVDGDEWTSASFLVLDEFTVEMRELIDGISDKVDDVSDTIEDLDVEGLSSSVQSVEDDVEALKDDVAGAASAADDAKSAADSAKSTADSAKSAADSAKSAADSAKSAADSAKSAAEDAESAAEGARGAAEGLTTLVYAAIAASAIAAGAAIVAILQLRAKIQ